MYDNKVGNLFVGESPWRGIQSMLTDTEILEAIRRKRENVEWVSGAASKLREKYGGRYVAVKDRKVIDVDENFEVLLARVRKRADASSITIEYVTEAEYLWIL